MDLPASYRLRYFIFRLVALYPPCNRGLEGSAERLEQGHTIVLPVNQRKSQYPRKTKRDVRSVVVTAVMMAVTAATIVIAIRAPILLRVVSFSHNQVLTQPSITLPFRVKGGVMGGAQEM